MIQVLIAFFGAVGLTMLLRHPARRAGLVDRPSGRKQHHAEVPVVGGLAMGVTFVATAVVFGRNYPQLSVLLMVTFVLLVTGVLDDRHDLPARAKLIAQIVVALLMANWGGQLIGDVGDLIGTGKVVLGVWALPFTVFAVVGVINAMNMIDGMDGLAGSIAMSALAWFAVVAALSCAEPQMYLLFVLMSVVAGFLLFNLRYPMRQRAQVFMGDAGSMMLGLVLAWFAVDLTHAGGPTRSSLYPISAVWILGVPIMDTLYLMGRRIVRGSSPFAADRRHIHHTLVFMGLSEGASLFVVALISVACGAVGFFGWHFGVPEAVLSYAFVFTLCSYCFVMQNWRRIFAVTRKIRRVPHRAPVSAHSKG